MTTRRFSSERQRKAVMSRIIRRLDQPVSKADIARATWPRWKGSEHGGAQGRKEIGLKRYAAEGPVADTEWQQFRHSLKGVELVQRLQMLDRYVRKHPERELAKIRAANYLNALRRGGMIPKKKE